jgi:hypothetical protein
MVWISVIVFQVVVYVLLLLIYTAVGLTLITRALSALAPSARVVNSVFEAAQQRMWSFGAPYLGWVVLAVAVGLPVSGNGALLTFPQAGSQAREWGDNVATVGLFLWMSLSVAGTGGTAILHVGLTSGEDVDLARRIQYVVLAMVLIGPMMLALYWPGPFACLGMAIAVGSSALLHLNAIHLIAVIRRARSPRATAIDDLPRVEHPYAVHLSDVHMTLPGAKLVQGGDGGNAQMEFLARRWAERAVDAPTYLLVTGDLIDRGRAEEWTQVLPTLKRIKQLGVRVLVAPGNHDLATAYYHPVARALMAQSSERLRVVDSRRIKDYLGIAAELEPALECHDGRHLGEVLLAEEQQFTSLIEAWKLAALAAAERIRDKRLPWSPSWDPSQPDVRALATLHSRDAAEAAGILKPVLERVDALFSYEGVNVKKDQFTKELVSRRDFRFDRLVEQTFRWRRLWYSPFPLRVVDEEASVEFVIVNSNEPEPGLAGSGFGRLGGGQLGRLQTMISSSTARTLVVLMHHSICAWAQEEADRLGGLRVSMERWAFLAHETGECHRVLDALGREAPETCRRVFLCCGHRHGVSRVGQVVARAGDSGIAYPRLVIMESAALRDLSLGGVTGPVPADLLLALSRASGGELNACKVSVS